jgi:predicted nucleotidyltransferase
VAGDGGKIDAAVRRIVEVAHPRKVILFGSAARGETHRDSDADFLVVLEHVDRPRQESVRIRRALDGIDMPVDIVVVAEDQLPGLAERPGLIYREAMSHGRVVYDRAA